MKLRIYRRTDNYYDTGLSIGNKTVGCDVKEAFYVIGVMNVLYYYYYLIYIRVIPETRPSINSIFTLGFSISLWVNFSSQVVLIKTSCQSIGVWGMMSISLIIIGCLYYYFLRNERYKEVIESQPKFFENHILTTVIVVTFFLLSASSLVWGPIITKSMLDQC